MVNIVNFECKLHDASDFVDGESSTPVGDVCKVADVKYEVI